MENALRQVVVQIPWEGQDRTGKKVFEVFVSDLGAAIRTNAHNYDALEEIRKDLLWAVYQVEKMQAEAKYPNTMRKSMAEVILP